MRVNKRIASALIAIAVISLGINGLSATTIAFDVLSLAGNDIGTVKIEPMICIPEIPCGYWIECYVDPWAAASWYNITIIILFRNETDEPWVIYDISVGYATKDEPFVTKFEPSFTGWYKFIVIYKNLVEEGIYWKDRIGYGTYTDWFTAVSYSPIPTP